MASIHHYGLRMVSRPEMIGGTTTAAQSNRRIGSSLAVDSSEASGLARRGHGDFLMRLRGLPLNVPLNGTSCLNT